MTKRPAKPATDEVDDYVLDLTSAVPVLAFVGDGERHLSGIPARDLSANDLGRIVYQRRVAALDPVADGPKRPDPEIERDALILLAAELVASGLYDVALPDDPAPADGPTADEPGDQPEKVEANA